MILKIKKKQKQNKYKYGKINNLFIKNLNLINYDAKKYIYGKKCIKKFNNN